MSEFNLSFPLVNELYLGFKRNPGIGGIWTQEDIKKLSSGDILSLIHNVIREYSEIKPIQYLIDCDLLPSGGTIYRNIKGGKFIFNLNNIKLELIIGTKIGSFANNEKKCLNANVLDYLLAHTELIPESWKDKYIVFRGTTYLDGSDNFYVRCLRWRDGIGWDPMVVVCDKDNLSSKLFYSILHK